jgi:tRNA G10  N-methylase Trm11
MDPFTGLGSTAVACARTGVGFIGADLDEAYLKVAVERTRDATRLELPARGTARMRKAELRSNSQLSTLKAQTPRLKSQ